MKNIVESAKKNLQQIASLEMSPDAKSGEGQNGYFRWT